MTSHEIIYKYKKNEYYIKEKSSDLVNSNDIDSNFSGEQNATIIAVLIQWKMRI